VVREVVRPAASAAFGVLLYVQQRVKIGGVGLTIDPFDRLHGQRRLATSGSAKTAINKERGDRWVLRVKGKHGVVHDAVFLSAWV
jgi:hypothetical protein